MEQIISYIDFTIFHDKETGKFFYKDSEYDMVEVEQVATLSVEEYEDMTDAEIVEYDAEYDVGGEYDDYSTYAYFKFV